jgi:uncharacterized protein YegP (UPF0339 family)
MNGKTIRTGSVVDHKASRTDWARVKGLSDAAIDAAIADDADAYALDAEVLGRADSNYHYEVHRDDQGGFRWRLVAKDGEVLASSHSAYRSKNAVKNAIAILRAALLGDDSLAA